MVREGFSDVVQSVGALVIALSALALAGWLEGTGHSVSDWHKGILVASTTFFFSRRAMSAPPTLSQRKTP